MVRARKKGPGSGWNPRVWAIGVAGITAPTVTTPRAARSSGTLGWLRKKGVRRVRITKITRVWVARDSTHSQVAIAQNTDVRRIGAYAAIIAVPTAIVGIYGMNFEHMPELRQVWGYPAVLALLVIVCTSLYAFFKSKKWL
jgi:hypothetical protein